MSALASFQYTTRNYTIAMVFFVIKMQKRYSWAVWHTFSQFEVRLSTCLGVLTQTVKPPCLGLAEGYLAKLLNQKLLCGAGDLLGDKWKTYLKKNIEHFEKISNIFYVHVCMFL